MKRSPMPGAKKLMVRSAPLRRAALLRQGERTRDAAATSEAKAKPKPAAKPKTPKPSVWPAGMRAAARARAGDCCDMCGHPLPEYWECHHRRLKSKGGRDELVNALALHFPCHERAHNNREWSRVRGYIVHTGCDPATRPVLRHGRLWQLPTTSGWTDCDPPADYPPLTEENAA